MGNANGIQAPERSSHWRIQVRQKYNSSTFVPIDDERLFLSPDLDKLSGLVVGNPWRTKITPEAISAVVEWVRAGGRLLLLGFELGDRHHGGNLAELSRFFGIDPRSDIAAISRLVTTTSPY